MSMVTSQTWVGVAPRLVPSTSGKFMVIVTLSSSSNVSIPETMM